MEEEELKSRNQNKDDYDEEFLFFDALDEFPFYDCSEIFEPIVSDADSNTLSEKLPQVNLLRRRYSSSGGDADEKESWGLSSSVSFEKNHFSSIAEKIIPCPEIKENKGESENNFGNIENPDKIKLNLSSESVNLYVDEILKQENEADSRFTYADTERIHNLVEHDSSVREIHNANSSFLILLAGLIIKAIGFQFNLLISFFTFPIWLMYCSYMFVMDPFRVIKRGREFLIRRSLRICGCVFGNLWGLVYKWMKDHTYIFRWGLKFGWGLLWSVYVCIVLVILLVSAFVVGGILMRIMVEEPIRMQDNLDFDYTEKSPVAFVPIMECPGADCGSNCGERLEVSKLDGMRVIPPKHKLQVTVSLTLPESDYNRNLGIFQVRVDLLATGGKIIASSRRPSMLLFKSQPIRLLLTFLKIAPLLTGYISETQNVNLKFKGFVEGGIPTACIKVTIEQRAQFQPGAGIPEIYSASLVLESEQPLLKRIMWYWRKTLFVWVSLSIFTTELLFTLLCCKPIIIPRVRLRESSAINVAAGNSIPTLR